MTFKQEFKVYSCVHFHMCDYQSIYNVTTPGNKIFLYNYNFCMLFISGMVFSKERISNIWETTEVPWTLVNGWNFVSKLLQNTAVIQCILTGKPSIFKVHYIFPSLKLYLIDQLNTNELCGLGRRMKRFTICDVFFVQRSLNSKYILWIRFLSEATKFWKKNVSILAVYGLVQCSCLKVPLA